MTEYIQSPVTNYKGAQLAHIYRGPAISGTVAVDYHGKLSYEGPLCVDHLTNSYRYGEECHVVVYQKEEPRYVLREARSRDWHRIELHVSPSEMDRLASFWLAHRGFDVVKR